MTIDEALTAHLKGFAGLNALIAGRVFPVNFPPGAAFPLITFAQTSGQRFYAFGVKGFDPQPVFQFDSWSPSKLAALNVREQIILSLDTFNGLMGGAGGVNIEYAQIVSEGAALFDQETGLHHPTIDFRITYQV